MFAFFRVALPAFVVLTILYVMTNIWWRLERRKALEAEWEAEPQGDREQFIQEGLEAYDRSYVSKLTLGIYIVPIAIVAVMIFLMNHT